MEKKYVAMFKRTVQISPDDFEVITETKICTQETTIGEIDDWVKVQCNAKDNDKLYCQIVTAD